MAARPKSSRPRRLEYSDRLADALSEVRENVPTLFRHWLLDKRVTLNAESVLEIYQDVPRANSQDPATYHAWSHQDPLNLLACGFEAICYTFVSWVVFDSEQFSARFFTERERTYGQYQLCSLFCTKTRDANWELFFEAAMLENQQERTSSNGLMSSSQL